MALPQSMTDTTAGGVVPIDMVQLDIVPEVAGPVGAGKKVEEGI